MADSVPGLGRDEVGGESKIIEFDDVEVGDDLETFVAGSSGTVGVLRSPAAAATAPGARPPSESSTLVIVTESVFIISAAVV